jgi:hypothetical protein
MLTRNTLDTLRQLKLTGMCDALKQQRAQPDTHDCLTSIILAGRRQLLWPVGGG